MKKKSSLQERLLMATIFVPTIVLIILFDFDNYPLLNLAIAFFSGVASLEMSGLLKKAFNISISPIFAFFLGVYSVFITYILSFLGFQRYFWDIFLLSYLLITFCLSLFLLNNKEKTVKDLFEKVISVPIISFYPSLLFIYTTRISFLEKAPYFLMLLAFIVFLNDSFAYIFGSLLGKKLPGSLKVSPKKTIVGFIGGVFATVLSLTISKSSFGLFSTIPFWALIIIGILMGILVIWGDLLESAFKRRADIKDSGTLVKGRGGVLDSVDSFFFIAPFYYYFILLFG